VVAESFRFRHAVFTIQVELDDERIEARGGMRSQVAPVPRLEHLFVRRDKQSDQAELLLSWRTAGGKLKRIRIFSDFNEPGFEGLVAALLARRPDIDRRGLSLREAYRLSGSKELDGTVLAVGMGLALAIVALMFMPQFRHGFDSGHATVPVERLASGPPLETRNLTVLGKPLLDYSLMGEAGGDRRMQQVTAWIPLVPEGWQPEDPVYAVLEVRGFKEDPVAFGGRWSFDVIMRDIAWEGLSAPRKAALVGRGVTLAPQVKLLEYGAQRHHDLYLAGGVLGLLGVLGLAVFIGVRRRRVG
jgi:hypothetical protein